MQKMAKNERFLNVLKGEKTDCTPVWLMRQAGRYLPEYRKTREKAGSFLNLCKTPELACEVTLQPLKRFDLDAAILFSDILTIPDAMGLGLYFSEGEGPQFEKPLQNEKDIWALGVPDPCDSLNYVLKAVSTIKNALNDNLPLIGFAGSPWTLACYMVEGKSSRDFQKIKKMLYTRPDLLNHILEKTTKAIALYLEAQIQAGADCVMIFDTWGGVLADEHYEIFSLNWMKKIIKHLKNLNTPSVIFTKGGGLWLDKMAQSGASALGLDWTMNLQRAFEQVGNKVALQGNLDPAILNAPLEVLEKQVQQLLRQVPKNARHIFNLGHGITPSANPENVRVLVDCVHQFSKK